MAVKIEKRDVPVKTCDFCHEEVRNLDKCVICKRDMCNAGVGKHSSHSLEVYSYKSQNKICSAYVCTDCAEKKTDLTIGQLLDGMFGESPVPTITNIPNPRKKFDWLLESMVTLGIITIEQLGQACAEAKQGSAIDVLLEKGIITRAQIATAKAAQFGARVIVLRETYINPATIVLVPAKIARKYRIVPVEKVEGRITIAIADPSDLNTIDSLTHLLNTEIEIRVAAEDDIEEALLKYYPDSEVQSDEKAESLRSVGPSSDMRGTGIVD